MSIEEDYCFYTKAEFLASVRALDCEGATRDYLWSEMMLRHDWQMAARARMLEASRLGQEEEKQKWRKLEREHLAAYVDFDTVYTYISYHNLPIVPYVSLEEEDVKNI
jgi:hypothetical protein